jgi:TrmH family RNA methyltransferase
MKSIQPISRAKLSSLRKLLQKKHRAESGKFLVEGARGVEELLASDWMTELVVMTKEFMDSHGQLLSRLNENHILANTISSRDLRTISDTEHPQGVLAVVQQHGHRAATLEKLRKGLIVVADEITEPGNLGAIIRTCDWFGVDAVVVSKDSVELFNPKVVRATAGSMFHFPIITDVETKLILQNLRDEGFDIYATVAHGGVDCSKVQWSEKAAVVFGNEAQGISEEIQRLADTKIQVPRIGKAESLNVGIACGVVLACVRLEVQPQKS